MLRTDFVATPAGDAELLSEAGYLAMSVALQRLSGTGVRTLATHNTFRTVNPRQQPQQRVNNVHQKSRQQLQLGRWR